METYARSGITIDQCTDCRGIYLDRGELLLLIDAEAAYFHPQQPVPATPGPNGAPRAPDKTHPQHITRNAEEATPDAHDLPEPAGQERQ